MSVQYFETDGGKLAYEIQGSGPLIICSPALADHRDVYGPLVTALSGYKVLHYDIRGHGDSSTFKRYGDEATADDLIALIKAFGDGQPAILIGASMSGSSAVIAAGREPSLVAGIVLIAGFLRAPAGALMRSVFNVLLKRPVGPIIWKGQCGKLWVGLEASALQKRTEETMKLLQRPGRWEALQETIRGADHSVVTPWIPKVKAPVLVIVGDKDPDWSDPVAEAKWVESQLPGSELLVVKGVGHAPMLEAPDQVSPKVTQFVQKCLAK